MLQEQASAKEATKKALKENPFTTLWNALLARNGTVAYLPIIFVAILMFCGASWQIFWSSTDAARYQCYALVFWLGGGATKLLPSTQCFFLNSAAFTAAPFHTLPLEYPPLTLAIFSLSLLAPIPYYQLLFALWMALTAVLIYWLLLRYGPHGSALAFAIYALVGAWATAEGRFDMVPAALTLLCLIAAERKHWTAAYVALVFGVLLKIYPILFLPALFIAEQFNAQTFHRPQPTLTLKTAPSELWHTLREARHWRWKNTLIFLGILAGITGIFALIDFQGAVVSQVTYFAHRPVQIESTGSIFLWIATKFGFPAYVVYTFGSLNIISRWDNAVSLLFGIAF
ncbi:MAG TPA: glycosyltransferase family 87 protein, partial [Ktedonobacteraceae bacterium]|nr:glycosyltransferase family 87 protein [Ktedonobacteraceae bacterium]